MVDENIARMIDLSEEKRNLVDGFYSLTLEQNKIIRENSEDKDPLGQVIEEKFEIIKKIDLLDRDFLSDYEEMKEKLGVESLADMDASKYEGVLDLKEIIRDITVKFEEIASLDEENNRMIRSNMDKVKSELRSVKGAKKAHKGYGLQQENQSMMIDERK